MLSDGDRTKQSTYQVLGRYRLLRRIGRGGMGDVWLAEDPRLHRQVAIKTLPSHNQQDREYLLRFEREAQAAAALNHPHILPVHDYGEQLQENGQVITYIVMPYISGGSLAERMMLYNTQTMPVEEVLFYLRQAAEAIDYAHSQKVIHRDIKPGNMLLRHDNWLLLADFGIARMLSEAEQLTRTGVGFGTPEYMAPEQAQGKARAASDNYSLAVIAYQLLTGRLPFKAETSYATTMQHLMLPPPSPRQFNPALSHGCEQVLLRGLAKDPQHRQPSACAFFADVQQAIQSASFEPTQFQAVIPPTQPVIAISDGKGPVTKNEGQRTKLRPQQQLVLTRRQIMLGGSGTALALALGGIGWAVASHTSSTTSTGRITPVVKATHAINDPNAPVMTLLDHNKPARSLSWSPSKNVLISSGSGGDGQVFLWDVDASYQQKNAGPQPVQKHAFDNVALGTLAAWSPDGQVVAFANTGSYTGNLGDSSFTVYKGDLTNPAPGYELQPIVVPATIETFDWLNTSSILTLSIPLLGAAFQLSVYDWTQPQKKIQPATISGYLSQNTNDTLSLSHTKSLAIAPTGSHIAISTTAGLLVGQVKVVGNTVTWQQQGPVLRFSNNGIANEVDGIAWNPTGTAIYAYSNSGLHPQVVVWSIASNTNDPQLLGDPKSPVLLTTIARSAASSQSLLAVGNMNGTVYLWNVTGNGLVERTLQGPQAEITALAWSFDGQWLAASFADTNDSILVWKL